MIVLLSHLNGGHALKYISYPQQSLLHYNHHFVRKSCTPQRERLTIITPTPFLAIKCILIDFVSISAAICLIPSSQLTTYCSMVLVILK